MQIWVEGETAPRTFTFRTADEAQNLNGASLEMIVYDVDGEAVTFQGTSEISDGAAGEVTFTPHVDDFDPAAGPYTVLWKVTFADTSIAYFPSTGADRWIVRDLLTPLPHLTFGQLRTQVLRWLDAVEDYNTGSTLDEIVKQQIQEANFQRCTEYPWWFMKAQTQKTVTGASRRLALPGDCRSLSGLWSPAAKDWLVYVPDRMIDVYRGRMDFVATGNFSRTPYILEGTTVRFLEPPTPETLIVLYQRAPTFLDGVSDVSDIPFPHTSILVWDALLDLKTYAKEAEDIRIWENKQARAEKNLYEAMKEGDILGGIIPTIKPGSELR